MVIRKGIPAYEPSREVEMDVCDWLDANPNIKAVVDGVIEAYLDAVYKHPNFVPSNDVVHAAAIVVEEAGELCRAANNVYWRDDVVDRTNMHVEANQVAASALRFLEHIGDLKGAER